MNSTILAFEQQITAVKEEINVLRKKRNFLEDLLKQAKRDHWNTVRSEKERVAAEEKERKRVAREERRQQSEAEATVRSENWAKQKAEWAAARQQKAQAKQEKKNMLSGLSEAATRKFNRMIAQNPGTISYHPELADLQLPENPTDAQVWDHGRCAGKPYLATFGYSKYLGYHATESEAQAAVDAARDAAIDRLKKM